MSGKIRVYKLRLRKSDTSARQEFVGTRHEAEARLRSWMSTDPIEHRAEIDPIEIQLDKTAILSVLNQHASKQGGTPDDPRAGTGRGS